MRMMINGLEVDVDYSKQEREEVLNPLLKQISSIRQEKGERIIVYLAAPPGTGKTTLSQFLELAYKELDSPYSFQSISIDGFHHKAAYLEKTAVTIEGQRTYLKNIKGSPESFDLHSLKKHLSGLKKESVSEWPIYDRKLHDVSNEHIQVDAEIVLIEGNWLLLNEDGWRDLKVTADLTLFIEAEEDMLKPRLINRKIMGGLNREAATAFYESSDRKNVIRVLEHHSEPDVKLKMMSDGSLKWG